MTRLLCPDGCKNGDEPRDFMNVQALRMHLLHRGGDGVHPERTQSAIDKLIFKADILPEANSTSSSEKKGIPIKKRRDR